MTATTIVRKTAKDISFKDAPAWIQTLNSVHRADAERESHFATASKLLTLRKGQPTYKAFKVEFEGMHPDERVKFLVGHDTNMGRYLQKAVDKCPQPLYPERDEKDTDITFTEKVGAYEKATSDCITARGNEIKRLQTQAAKEYAALAPHVMVERCLTAHTEVMYSQTFQNQNMIQTLYRAVRKADNHLEFYFSSAEEVADLPDEQLEFLNDEYININTVQPSEIPT